MIINPNLFESIKKYMLTWNNTGALTHKTKSDRTVLSSPNDLGQPSQQIEMISPGNLSTVFSL